MNNLLDFLGRAVLVAFSGALATLKAISIVRLAKTPNADVLEILSHAASLSFVLLVIFLALFRLKPMRGAQGWEPRFSALAGSLLPMAPLALPLAEMPAWARIVALALIAIGWLLSVYVLAWLGRSFSVMAQARKLVVAGPYGVVRHPLYLAEEIAVLGILLLYFSPIALGIGVIHWLFQLRRMANEEAVLRSAFPEYESYSKSTPRVIPRLSRGAS